MGEAADRKVIEIDEARTQLELDLRELEERLPVPLRWMKSVVGMFIGSAVLMFLVLRRFRSKKSPAPAAEVVVRYVREDSLTRRVEEDSQRADSLLALGPLSVQP